MAVGHGSQQRATRLVFMAAVTETAATQKIAKLNKACFHIARIHMRQTKLTDAG